MLLNRISATRYYKVFASGGFRAVGVIQVIVVLCVISGSELNGADNFEVKPCPSIFSSSQSGIKTRIIESDKSGQFKIAGDTEWTIFYDNVYGNRSEFNRSGQIHRVEYAALQAINTRRGRESVELIIARIEERPKFRNGRVTRDERPVIADLHRRGFDFEEILISLRDFRIEKFGNYWSGS